MRRLDRYILSELSGPLLFGVGTFLVVLVGAQLAPYVLKLLVRENYPLDIALQIFIYRLPGLVALTFPMAAMFGSLMALLTLSSQGEVIAMRAGGVSLQRLAAPVLGMGLVISLATLLFNEVLTPGASERAQELVINYSRVARPREHFTFSIPSTGVPQRIVHVEKFDPAARTLVGLLIVEMQAGKFWQLFSAERAEWQGEEWLLINVERTVALPGGAQRRERIAKLTYDVGRSPADMLRVDRDLQDMRMSELYRLLEERRRQGLPYKPDQLSLLQMINLRLALPWASVGFALIGVPLGIRPMRATTGVGLGISLIIVFAYYVLFNTMNLIGQQGTLAPWFTAWFPNVILYSAGLLLFAGARRR